ncbi:MAG: thioesterase family protein, partial [Xanthobacteraceae bacterium]
TPGETVRTPVRLIDNDEKRIHFYAELYHAQEGWLSATSEQMALHVDMASKKVVPLPDDVLDRLAAMKAAHAALPAPEGIGRKIAMAKRS